VNGWVPTLRGRRANDWPGDKAREASERTAFRRESKSECTSDVRDEAVPELTAHESALQGQLAEAYKEDHV